MTAAARCFIAACLIGSLVILVAAARADLLFIPLFMTYLIVALAFPRAPRRDPRRPDLLRGGAG